MANESEYLGLARRIVGDLTGRDWPTKSEEVARMLARNCQDATTITALQAEVERLRGLLRGARRKLALQPHPLTADKAADKTLMLARIDKELSHEG